jgi:CRP-like cAMP-binding protein
MALDRATISRNGHFAGLGMLLSDARSILCRHGWLSRQPSRFQHRWLASGVLRFHAAGDALFVEGERPNDLCGLVLGNLTITFAPNTRSSLPLHIARPGWWAGDLACISDGPRRASLTARSDSWVVHVGLPAVRAMAAEDPEVWRRVAQISVGHFDHAMNIVASLTAGGARARVIMALRRLVDLDDNLLMGNATLQVSQKELCAMAHVSRNAIAPLLMDLEKSGLISRRYRRIEILDLRALRALSKQTRPSRIVDDGV